jgi:hypothetical protein
VRVRKADVAETMLSLVGSTERAHAFVGDLLEERDRGRFWFWRSVLRLALSWLLRDLSSAPVAMALSSVLAWFLYMLVSLVVGLIGYVVVTLLWGVGYVFANHTGVELLTEVLKIRFDWPPIAPWATYAIQAVALFGVAPFLVGRGSSPYWRGHELSLTIVMLMVWTMMASLVPLVGVGIAARPSLMPIAALFVLIGLVSARRPTPVA